MKKSKVLRVLGLISVVLLLVLGACSNNSANSNSGSSSKRIKITYWHRMTGDYQKSLNAIISDFNKSQDKYEVVGQSQGSYVALQQKIMAAAKSNTLPTIGQAPYTNIGDYVKNGLILPLDSHMLSGSDKLSDAQMKDLYPSFLSSTKYNDKYYAIPFSVSTRVLYYNKDLMAKYNISMPKTYADFAAMGPKLKAAGLYSVIFDTSYDMELEGMAHAAGAQLITPDLKANLNNPKTLAAANLIMGLINDKYARTAGEDQYFSVPFANSKTVFGIGSSATVPTLISQAPKALNWGVAQVPSYEGKSGTALAGNDIVMFKGASKDQQKGAWLFMKYLMKSKVSAQWAEQTGYVPVSKSASTSASYKTYLKKNPKFQAAVDSVKDSFSSTVFVGYSDYRNDLMTAVDATITKHSSVDSTFNKLQTQTEAILKNAK